MEDPTVEKFRAIVISFLKSTDVEIEFPNLSFEERKIIHSIAEECGISHKSEGEKENEKRLILSKSTTKTRKVLVVPICCSQILAKINISVKKRFVRDCSLPIPVLQDPYFEYFLELYDNVFETKKKFLLLKESIAAFGTETLFMKEEDRVSGEFF
jgi:hypothetical protein